MRIILDELDEDVYGDIVISHQEVMRLQRGEMVDGCTVFQRNRLILGVRLQGLWDEEEDDWEEEDRTDDERIWEE